MSNTTTGGTTASYAMLGDVHIAEPGALIGFAGKRVIMEALKLSEGSFPPGFQTAESLIKQGMLDMIVHRKKMKSTLASLLEFMR